MANEVPASTGCLDGLWPKGLYPLYFFFGHTGNSEVPIVSALVPFKCTVKAAYAGGGAPTSDPSLAIATIEATPQTIVSAVNITTAASDAGKIQTLTVADSGPIVAGTCIACTLTNDAGDVQPGLCVTLLLEPAF